MRVMLGRCNKPPSLLVDMDSCSLPQSFWVINGAWPGVLHKNGEITIIHPTEPYSTFGANYSVVCSDEDRLRGDYQDVFDNFDNPNYIAPKSKIVFDDLDDDIAF